jgi:putative DNA-invertase from lambdoid prophage Rac
MFRAGLYARVSTNDQQTLAMQNRNIGSMRRDRGWTITMQVREVNSGAARRESREKALEAARRWRLDLLATLDHRRAHLPGSHRRTLGAVE